MAEVLGGPAETPGTPGEHAPARDDAGAAVTALFRDHHLELVRLALPLVLRFYLDLDAAGMSSVE